MGCRIIYDNLILRAGNVIVPSSEVTSLPRAALLRPLLSDVLRFKLGWDINGDNADIDFDRGGPHTAVVATANYPTGASLAAVIEPALEAAEGGAPDYVGSYSGTTHFYTLLRNGGIAWTVNFATGPNLAKSMALDLGFPETDNTAITQVSSAVAYQSRRTVNVDLGAAATFGAAIIGGHNVSAAGTVRLDAKASDMLGQGMRSSVATFSATLAGSSGLRLAYFSNQSFRYLRLVITDVQNPAGYNELGVFSVAPVLDLIGFDVNVVDEREELSDVAFAIGGAQHQISRPARKVWHLTLHAIDDAKKVELETFAASVKLGGCFFFDFDGLGTNVRYVFLDRGLSFQAQETVPRTWTVEMMLKESLG